MYDFNPLSTLFLLKALPTDAKFPSPWGKLKRLGGALLHRAKFRRPTAVEAAKLPARHFIWPTHASYPSYSVPTPADATAR